MRSSRSARAATLHVSDSTGVSIRFMRDVAPDGSFLCHDKAMLGVRISGSHAAWPLPRPKTNPSESPYSLEVTRTRASAWFDQIPDLSEASRGDRVSSVYGTDVHPLTVRAPKGVFNSPYNGSWSASGMNPKFFEIMPDMADDTYATIGLSTAAKMSGIDGAEDPTMVQDPGLPWDVFFTESGETDLDISTHTGGAYFVLRTAANGAGQDGRVFLMQVTTAGDLSGAINLQLFPASGDYDQVRYRFEFKGKGEYPGIAIE